MEARIAEETLARWVRERFGAGVSIRSVTPLGGEAGEKGFGYGIPLRIALDSGPVREVVLHLSGAEGFGHDTLADRAADALLSWETFGNLPGHVRPLDVGYLAGDGRLVSVAGARDFWIATEYGEGEPYFHDLEKLQYERRAGERDLARAELLAAALARIHADRHHHPELHRRRIRDLFGGHECIAGLLDSYVGADTAAFAPPGFFAGLEARLVPWRLRLRDDPTRLCRVHGDFHPWNILFAADDRVTFLDRSRGEWGEAADDVACLAINYLFFSLRAHGRLARAYAELWSRFFRRYREETDDAGLLERIAPFFVFRALVLASPLWYPNLAPEVRAALLRFASRVLDLPRFDPHGVNALLGTAGPAAAAPGSSGGARRAIWIAGRPAAGKTTLAGRVLEALAKRGIRGVPIDSDEARRALTPAPAYDDRERELVYRSFAYAADRLAASGAVPVVAATAGTAALRAAADRACPGIFWVQARCSREVAARRDPKGLYEAAARGAIGNLPGAGAPYEEPGGVHVVDTDAPVADRVVEALVDAFLAPPAG